MAQKKAFLMRIDPKLFAALQRWAGDELRSVNGQVEYLLLQAVKKAGRKPSSSKADSESQDEL